MFCARAALLKTWVSARVLFGSGTGQSPAQIATFGDTVSSTKDRSSKVQSYLCLLGGAVIMDL